MYARKNLKWKSLFLSVLVAALLGCPDDDNPSERNGGNPSERNGNNSAKDGNGSTKEITTPSDNSTIIDANSITSTSATLGGNISPPGYIERGVCYSTAPNPTIYDSKVVAPESWEDIFGVHITRLTPNTTYYARSYAVNAEDIVVYGGQLIFTTLAQNRPPPPPSSPTSISVNPIRSNVMMFSSINADAANTSFPKGYLYVGKQWFASYMPNLSGVGGYWYITHLGSSSALYFNVDSQISGKNIRKAELQLFVREHAPDMNITYAIAAFAGFWGSNITANTVPNNYVAEQIFKAPPAPGENVWTVDVTNIVRNWASGTWTNNGFLLYDTDITHPYLSTIRITNFHGGPGSGSPDKWWPVLYVEFQ
jgi:hypothetical protein